MYKRNILFSVGILAALTLLVSGVKAVQYSSGTVTRSVRDMQTRIDTVCQREIGWMGSVFVCSGVSHTPDSDSEPSENCGNAIVEAGEECDVLAPAGYICTNQCQLQEVEPDRDDGASAGIIGAKLVINELYPNVDPDNGVDKTNEWVELYNAGDLAVNLNGWSLQDSEKLVVEINIDLEVLPGEFVLFSPEAETFAYWSETIPAGTKVISLGTIIGDGLNNEGDYLKLKNPLGADTDGVSYGGDTFFQDNVGPKIGESFSRQPNGIDTNSKNDWKIDRTPTPGF